MIERIRHWRLAQYLSSGPSGRLYRSVTEFAFSPHKIGRFLQDPLQIIERRFNPGKRLFILLRFWKNRQPACFFQAGQAISRQRTGRVLGCRENIADFQYLCARKFSAKKRNFLYLIFGRAIQNYIDATGLRVQNPWICFLRILSISRLQTGHAGAKMTSRSYSAKHHSLY